MKAVLASVMLLATVGCQTTRTVDVSSSTPPMEQLYAERTRVRWVREMARWPRETPDGVETVNSAGVGLRTGLIAGIVMEDRKTVYRFADAGQIAVGPDGIHLAVALGHAP